MVVQVIVAVEQTRDDAARLIVAREVEKVKRSENGVIVEYKELLTFDRTDGWFICIAPLENPQVAIAVVLEDIGSQFGGGTAAPVAANVILKARELGLLGEKYRPKAAPPKPTAKKHK